MYKNRPIKLTLAALACEVQDVRWMQIHSFQVTWLKLKNLRLSQPARGVPGSWGLKEKASKLTSNHIFNLRIVEIIWKSIWFHIVSEICATIEPVIQKDAPCPLPVGPAFAKKKGAPKMKAEKATKHQNKSNASSEQKGNTIAYSYAVKNSWYNVNIHCIWTYISINYIF